MNRKTGLRRVPLEPGNPPARRTPLARNAPLQAPRAAQGARETGAKGKSAATGRGGMGQRKAMPAGEFSDATKLLVRKRAGRGDIFDSACEACGRHLGEKAGEFQHRAARGSGGCRDAVINGPANCAFMCHECHRRAEARAPEMGSDPHLAEDAGGFWIGHGTTPEYDPRNVQIMLHSASGGLTVYLAEDGLGPDGTGYLYQQPGAVAA